MFFCGEQEIDVVEEYESGNRYVAYECKYTHKHNIQVSKVFSDTYKNYSLEIVTRENIVKVIHI